MKRDGRETHTAYCLDSMVEHPMHGGKPYCPCPCHRGGRGSGDGPVKSESLQEAVSSVKSGRPAAANPAAKYAHEIPEHEHYCERIRALEAELGTWKGAADVQKYRAEKAEEEGLALMERFKKAEAEVERLKGFIAEATASSQSPRTRTEPTAHWGFESPDEGPDERMEDD